MKRKAIIILIILSYITLSSYAQSEITDVTYVSNKGVLIKTGDKKVYIETLFDSSKGKIELPQRTQDKLSHTQDSFENTDLIFVSHSLTDVLSPKLIKDYLEKNPNAFFASTGPIVEALKEFPDRYVYFNPTQEKPDKKVINDITIEAFYFPPEPKMQKVKIAFIVSIDGESIFQTEYFETDSYQSKTNDI